MNKCNKILKIISLFLIVTFSFQQTFIYSETVTVNNPNIGIKKIDVDNYLAQVENVAINDGKDLIINIQDSHASLSTQYRIVEILNELIHKYDINVVAVEGGSGYIDTSILKTFPDKDIREATAEYFLSEGKISAGEFFSATTDKNIALYGVEDNELYNKNLNEFRHIHSNYSHYLPKINDVLKSLILKENDIYNKDLLKLVNKYRLHRDGKIGFMVYRDVLEELCVKNNIDIGSYESIKNFIEIANLEVNIDFNLAASQRKELINDIISLPDKNILKDLILKSLDFEKGKIGEYEYYKWLISAAESNGISINEKYKELEKYFLYIDSYDSINIIAMDKDIREIEGKLFMALAKNGEEKELFDAVRFVEELIALFEIKLNRDSLSTLSEHLNIGLNNFLEKSFHARGINPVEIIKNAKDALIFYKMADQRDKAIIDNTVMTMRREGKHVAALITGGHHTTGLSEVMNDNKLSYLVIMPKAAKDVERPYVTVLTNKSGPYSSGINTKDSEIAAPAYFPSGKVPLNDDIDFDTILAYAVGQSVLSGANTAEIISGWITSYRKNYEAVMAQEGTGYLIPYLTPQDMETRLKAINIEYKPESDDDVKIIIGDNIYTVTTKGVQVSSKKYKSLDGQRTHTFMSTSLEAKFNSILMDALMSVTTIEEAIKNIFHISGNGNHIGAFPTLIDLPSPGSGLFLMGVIDTIAIALTPVKEKAKIIALAKNRGLVLEADDIDHLNSKFFRGVTEHLLHTAEIVNLKPELLNKLFRPYRMTAVDIVIEMPIDKDIWYMGKRYSYGDRMVFKGYDILHNIARGLAKGGIRFVPEVDLAMIRSLATEMTWKTSVVGIPFGGGKGGIAFNPRGFSYDKYGKVKLPQPDQQLIIELILGTYVQKLMHKKHPLTQYTRVPAPDFGSTPGDMEVILEAYAGYLGLDTEDIPSEVKGLITGKPVDKGGSEGRTQATGQGVFYVTREAVKVYGEKLFKTTDMNNLSYAFQGAGNVAFEGLKFFYEMGVRNIKYISDVSGYLHFKDGLESRELYEKLMEFLNRPNPNDKELKDFKKFLEENENTKSLSDLVEFYTERDDLLTRDVNVLIPAARENQIHEGNAHLIKAKLIVEGANGPTTPAGDRILKEREIISVPDILANAGGVEVSYLEWIQNIEGTRLPREVITAKLEYRMKKAFEEVQRTAVAYNTDLRTGAQILGVIRTADALIAKDEYLKKIYGEGSKEKPYIRKVRHHNPASVEEIRRIMETPGQFQEMVEFHTEQYIREVDEITEEALKKVAEESADGIVKIRGVILIDGPSAVGKPQLAVDIRKRLNAHFRHLRGQGKIAENYGGVKIIFSKFHADSDIINLLMGETIHVRDEERRYFGTTDTTVKLHPGDVTIIVGSETLGDEFLDLMHDRDGSLLGNAEEGVKDRVYKVGVDLTTNLSMEGNEPWTSKDARILRAIVDRNSARNMTATKVIEAFLTEDKDLRDIYKNWDKADRIIEMYVPYELPVLAAAAKGLMDEAVITLNNSINNFKRHVGDWEKEIEEMNKELGTLQIDTEAYRNLAIKIRNKKEYRMMKNQKEQLELRKRVLERLNKLQEKLSQVDHDLPPDFDLPVDAPLQQVVKRARVTKIFKPWQVTVGIPSSQYSAIFGKNTSNLRNLQNFQSDHNINVIPIPVHDMEAVLIRALSRGTIGRLRDILNKRDKNIDNIVSKEVVWILTTLIGEDSLDEIDRERTEVSIKLKEILVKEVINGTHVDGADYMKDTFDKVLAVLSEMEIDTIVSMVEDTIADLKSELTERLDEATSGARGIHAVLSLDDEEVADFAKFRKVLSDFYEKSMGDNGVLKSIHSMVFTLDSDSVKSIHDIQLLKNVMAILLRRQPEGKSMRLRERSIRQLVIDNNHNRYNRELAQAADRVEYMDESLGNTDTKFLVHFADGNVIMDAKKGYAVIPPGLEIMERREKQRIQDQDGDPYIDKFFIVAPNDVYTDEQKAIFRKEVMGMWLIEGLIPEENVVILDRREYKASEILGMVKNVFNMSGVQNTGIRVINGTLDYDEPQLIQVDIGEGAYSNVNQYEVLVNLLTYLGLGDRKYYEKGLDLIRADGRAKGRHYLYIPEARPRNMENEIKVYYERYVEEVLVKA